MAGSGRRVFTAGEVLTASNVMNYLMDQSVMYFASSTARTTGIGTAVSAGMVSYRADGTAWEGYNGSAWVQFLAGTVTSSQIASLDAAKVTTTVNDKSANYTLVSGDKNTFIRSTGSAITITVPDVLANGESVNFVQAGAGQITFAGSGVTINSVDAKLKTNKQYSGATITKLGGAYYLVGDLAA
jgi:hypothetical protein